MRGYWAGLRGIVYPQLHERAADQSGIKFAQRADGFLRSGDAGSHFVGYMLAVLPITVTFYRHGTTPTLLPVLIPLLVLAVPLFDLVMVTWIRLQGGQPIYQGDVNHLSHRLVRLGLPQSWAVTLIYLITLTLGLGATVLLWSQMTAALIVIVQAICILAIVTLLERLGGK